MRYKVLKTTMGRKYKVPMSEEEIAEREIFHMAVILLPFIFSALIGTLYFRPIVVFRTLYLTALPPLQPSGSSPATP